MDFSAWMIFANVVVESLLAQCNVKSSQSLIGNELCSVQINQSQTVPMDAVGVL